MAEKMADWRDLLRAELEANTGAILPVLDEVGRVLLEGVFGLRPCGTEPRPYRRFSRRPSETGDELAEDAANRAAFPPRRPERRPHKQSRKAPTAPPNFVAEPALRDLVAPATAPIHRSQVALRLLAADARFLLHPAVAMVVADWHFIIREAGHRSAGAAGELSVDEARDFMRELAATLGRGAPRGEWGRPDAVDFQYRKTAAEKAALLIESMAARRKGERAENREERRRAAANLLTDWGVEGLEARALVVNSARSPGRIADVLLAQHYGVAITVARRWRNPRVPTPGLSGLAFAMDLLTVRKESKQLCAVARELRREALRVAATHELEAVGDHMRPLVEAADLSVAMEFVLSSLSKPDELPAELLSALDGQLAERWALPVEIVCACRSDDWQSPWWAGGFPVGDGVEK